MHAAIKIGASENKLNRIISSIRRWCWLSPWMVDHCLSLLRRLKYLV